MFWQDKNYEFKIHLWNFKLAFLMLNMSEIAKTEQHKLYNGNSYNGS